MAHPKRRVSIGPSVLACLLVAALVYYLDNSSLLGAEDDKTDTSAIEPARAETPVTPTSVLEPASGLHPGLASALDRARASAADDGHAIPVSSGYRTAEQQLSMLEAAIDEYGSREEAEHWVFPPDRSMHVSGLAIDIGEGPSADWLRVNGHRYGLCQTLSWEWWHFEWRESWERSQSCPDPVDDPDDAPPLDTGR
jgi:LAS superfamily LD-carboxypeptidase LdcB